jgi:hypothetical protein
MKVTIHGNHTGIWKIMAVLNYSSSLTTHMRKGQHAASSAQPKMMMPLAAQQGS